MRQLLGLLRGASPDRAWFWSRFAASAYKDPRAPQNLIPIAGLERRLRALLGDPRLLHRALRSAAGGSTEPAPAGV